MVRLVVVAVVSLGLVVVVANVVVGLGVVGGNSMKKRRDVKLFLK